MTSRSNKRQEGASLSHAVLLAQIAVELGEQCAGGERLVGRLRAAVSAADRSVGALRGVAKGVLLQARKIAGAADAVEGDRLVAVIDRQLSELELKQMEIGCPESPELREIDEKIQQLENRQKTGCESSTVTPNSSSRNINTDERYPENLSRESLIDLNAVQNLPPVPEDIFTSFSSRPSRSSSLSSLKSMRKIKMYLQRAESSDDDDSSDAEDHDYSKLIYGDASEEQKMLLPHSPTNKKVLGNIKEEVHDQ